MKAKNLIDMYPTLSPEDAVYYEKRINWELLEQAETGELWFMCINPGCDDRSFMVTVEQFEEAGRFVECEYCGKQCQNTNKPEWANGVTQ